MEEAKVLQDAVRAMKENQIQNRELAVAAITAKNNLQAETARQERIRHHQRVNVGVRG